MEATEHDGFIREKVQQQRGCCHSKHTKNCCIATAVFGVLFIILGVLVLISGKGFLEKKILSSMAITEGSDRLKSWLTPPVQPYMEAYAFHVKNPEAVLQGKKPVVEERGPYVYKSDTLKDTDNNMNWGPETLTYRPRKIYTFVPELSKGNDPDKDVLTLPNIPFWTGLHKAGKKTGFARGIALDLVQNNGLGTPFINVTVSGVLWGYNDELPCVMMEVPAGCKKDSGDDGGFGGGEATNGDEGFGDNGFGGFGDDGFGGFGDDGGFDSFNEDDGEEGDGFFDEEDDSKTDATTEAEEEDFFVPKFKPPKDSYYEKLVLPKSEFVNCKCEWGLFRDRNVTMRKPIEFFTGVNELSKKGVVKSFDGKKVFNWWKEGSQCDKVMGQDGASLPPGLNKDSEFEIFIALMCRHLKLQFEKETEHAGIKSLRFIPPPNALGSHDDPNPERRNPDNECHCMKDEGFKCFASGVMYMEPCKRKAEAPLALSMPHFYQADESFRKAVHGLNPEKEKHEFYMDIVPEFGVPLAIQPRFQLNMVLTRIDGVEKIKNMEKEIVLPFFWAQVGFSEPSENMASQIKFGVEAPHKLPMLGAVVLFALGGLFVAVPLVYFVWMKRTGKVFLGNDRPKAVIT